MLDVTYLCLTGVCGVAYCGFDLKYYVMNVAATVPPSIAAATAPQSVCPMITTSFAPQVFYGIFHAPQVKAADEVSGVAYYKEVAYSGGKYVLRRYAGVGAGDDYRVGVLTVYCGIPAYFRGELCMVYGVRARYLWSPLMSFSRAVPASQTGLFHQSPSRGTPLDNMLKYSFNICIPLQGNLNLLYYNGMHGVYQGASEKLIC